MSWSATMPTATCWSTCNAHNSTLYVGARLHRHAVVGQCVKNSLPPDIGGQQHLLRRKLLLATFTLPFWQLGGSQQAAALPLAPLGRGTDTVGGPKLQKPALKEVQASAMLATVQAVLEHSNFQTCTPERFMALLACWQSTCMIAHCQGGCHMMTAGHPCKRLGRRSIFRNWQPDP